MGQQVFNGFPPCLFTFLEDLKEHNERAWFESHRSDYEACYLEPGRAFADELAGLLQGSLGHRNGTGDVDGSLFRIYRDVRFSKDKRPYKTHLAMSLGLAGSRREESAGYYLHLEPQKLYLGSGLHSFSGAMRDQFRGAVVDPQRGAELAAVVRQAESLGAALWGESYKRVPTGYDATHPNARFLLYGGLFAGQELTLPPETGTPGFLGFVADRLQALAPVARWLESAVVEPAEHRG